MPATKRKAKTEPVLSLTEKIQEASARKRRLQECRQEAEATTRKFQQLKDEAESRETELSLQYMQTPNPELAVQLKDARIETKQLIEQHDQAVKDLQNIPKGIKSAETEIRNLSGQKDILIAEIVKEKLPPAEVEKLENAAKQALATYGAALVMANSRNIGGSGITALVEHITRDRQVLSLMHETFYQYEKDFRFEEL